LIVSELSRNLEEEEQKYNILDTNHHNIERMMAAIM
jgi:hypothetical protein